MSTIKGILNETLHCTELFKSRSDSLIHFKKSGEGVPGSSFDLEFELAFATCGELTERGVGTSAGRGAGGTVGVDVWTLAGLLPGGIVGAEDFPPAPTIVQAPPETAVAAYFIDSN